MQYGAQDADQLWVNMCAASIISHTSALRSSVTKTDDRFYNKALNRDPAAEARRADPSTLSVLQREDAEKARAALSETELLIDIVNKLTYCRVTTFQSDCVKVVAMLSASVDAVWSST